jgi:hypothetical protein
LENIPSNFLGKERPENISEIVQELISYSAVMCNMSLESSFSALPFELFSENLEAVCNGHGYRFH